MRAAQFLAIIGRGSKGSNALENTEDRAGATSEQQDNVINTVNSLDPYGPSWQLVPGNVAAGTVYAQVPTSGTGDLTFTRASTKTRTNAAGTVVDVASGVAAIDYRNADGSLSSTGRLLLEPQRTNKQTQSENINGTDYNQNVQITISSNFATSPDGYQNADKIIPTAVSNYHAIRTSKATPNGYDIISCFVKASGYNYVQLTSWADPSSYVNFDLTDGTLGTVSTATVYGIQSYGNGWYRIWANVQASGGGIVGIQVVTSKTAAWAQSFTGNGTDGVLVWGVQIEAATYPTTYIPTTTAAVTRLADAASKTGVSSLIGQTEGTMFVDAYFSVTAAGRFLSINDGTTFNRILLVRNSTNTVSLVVQSTTLQVLITSGILPNGTHRFAASYANNAFSLYIDGTLIGTATSGTVPACSVIDVGNENNANFFGDSIAQAALFPTRLTNARLAEITTL
jgi:hypothetical protein